MKSYFFFDIEDIDLTNKWYYSQQYLQSRHKYQSLNDAVSVIYGESHTFILKTIKRFVYKYSNNKIEKIDYEKYIDLL